MSIKTIDYRIGLTLDMKEDLPRRSRRSANGKTEIRVDGQTDSIQCIRHELRRPPVAGALGPSARPILQVQGSRLLAGSRPDTRAWCFRRHLYCRRDRLLRRLQGKQFPRDPTGGANS